MSSYELIMLVFIFLCLLLPIYPKWVLKRKIKGIKNEKEDKFFRFTMEKKKKTRVEQLKNNCIY